MIEGKTPLKGTVQASGAKNAALPIMAACILLDGTTTLKNIPYLMDVSIMVRMLSALGLRTEHYKTDQVTVENHQKVRHIAPYELVTSMRASFFVAGPILAKTGFAKVPLPGGCSIGKRPVDIHLNGFKKLGATIKMEHGFVEIAAKELHGAKIPLTFPSVGATENLIMAASLATGTTTIENAAMEPEIIDLGNFLIAAGAQISGLGTPTITIKGVDKLHGVKEYSIIPDRIEVGTLLIAGAITHGDVTVINTDPKYMTPLLEILEKMGLEITRNKTSIRIKSTGEIHPIDIETKPFPGFPTDMQAQLMALLTVAKGTSTIKESIFENRFMHAGELKRMGANISLNKELATISGVQQLSGAEVKITDLRAGAALILAGLAAEGYTTVYGLKHLRRGYYNLAGKLHQLGAKIIE